MSKVVVVGAGVGGLTSAAALARAGMDVTVLEAQLYPGGCAGTFYHQGYRFNAGATLAGGFYPGGPMDRVAKAAGIGSWKAHPAEPAMVVHLPDGQAVPRWTDNRRYEAYRHAFGAQGQAFFRWQEQTADALWNLALRLPPWPPQTPGQFLSLLQKGLGWLGDDYRRLSPSMFADAFLPVAAHLKNAPLALRQFVDAQLLISAQATSENTFALYGASALDLPRRGVVHLDGGLGAIASRLAQAVEDNGGRVLYRQEVQRVVMEKGRPAVVEAQHGIRGPVNAFDADAVVFNLPPWNIAHLLGEFAPPKLRNLPDLPPKGWGGFVIYAGVDGAVFPQDFPLHHQVIAGGEMGEGRTVFLSLSPVSEPGRAPRGKRALTISTHTALEQWWQLYEQDRLGYEALKKDYVERMLSLAERAVPGLRQAIDLILPGTPVTFERFTGRAWGWVGGFPQTDLWQAWGPRLGKGLWMVGDSIFPGQSTAAVALGGLRVAQDVSQVLGYSPGYIHSTRQQNAARV